MSKLPEQLLACLREWPACPSVSLTEWRGMKACSQLSGEMLPSAQWVGTREEWPSVPQRFRQENAGESAEYDAREKRLEDGECDNK